MFNFVYRATNIRRKLALPSRQAQVVPNDPMCRRPYHLSPPPPPLDIYAVRLSPQIIASTVAPEEPEHHKPEPEGE